MAAGKARITTWNTNSQTLKDNGYLKKDWILSEMSVPLSNPLYFGSPFLPNKTGSTWNQMKSIAFHKNEHPSIVF